MSKQTSGETAGITYLQVLTHILGERAEPNASEIIDGEPRVLRDIHGEHPLAGDPDFRILEPLRQLLQPHALHHLVHHDLHEDTATGGRVVFVDFDAAHDRPGDGVGREEVSEEFGDVSQAIRFVPMDCVIVCLEGLLQALCPYTIQLAEPFANETVEF